MTDLVIRGGTVIDGRGGDPFEADVAIDAGRIAAVGKIADRGVEEFEARGLLVTADSSFIDLPGQRIEQVVQPTAQQQSAFDNLKKAAQHTRQYSAFS